MQINPDILEMWCAFTDAVARFWNNRFLRDMGDEEEIRYLRMELDKERAERTRLISLLVEPPVKQENQVATDFRPVNEGFNWGQQRKKLEKEDRERAVQMREKMAQEFEATKSTEQLEHELGVE